MYIDICMHIKIEGEREMGDGESLAPGFLRQLDDADTILYYTIL